MRLKGNNRKNWSFWSEAKTHAGPPPDTRSFVSLQLTSVHLGSGLNKIQLHQPTSSGQISAKGKKKNCLDFCLKPSIMDPLLLAAGERNTTIMLCLPGPDKQQKMDRWTVWVCYFSIQKWHSMHHHAGHWSQTSDLRHTRGENNSYTGTFFASVWTRPQRASDMQVTPGHGAQREEN